MTDQINKSIFEVLPDFFDKNQLDEFISLYKSSLSGKLEAEKFQEEKEFEYKVQDGLNYRSQVDLLITFSGNNLPREKFLSLLLYISQASITNGEFLAAIDINQKIIALTVNDKNMIDLNANAHLLVGEIYSRQANWQDGFSFVNRALDIFTTVNDVKGIAKCENLLGTIHGDLGDIKKAIENFESALEKSNDESNYIEKAKIEINLGIVSSIKGFFDEALVFFKRALINYTKVDDKKRIAEIHQNIGMVYTKKGDYQYAIKEFDESLSYAIETNYLQNIGIVYLSKAFAYSKMNDFSLANAFADKSMEVAHKLNDKLTIAEVYKIKGIIQRSVQNYILSENYLETSLRLNIEAGNQLNRAETYQELGVLYNAMGKLDKSKENFKLALQFFKKINSEPDITNLENLLASK
ncbi:MAG: tetratricopeptide repeat protein [Ignavibacteriales bacterium]|nr:tetratricopeptide repeat protein [Ignavibacteriales bacterium]